MASPTVSVIIPAYNAAKTVSRSIASVLEQTHPPLEVIVVDDGSSDNTAAVVSAMPAPVRLERKKNGGPASARNWGARNARGEWLALLDSDDWWMPTKIEKQLQLANNPNVALIHTLANTSRPNVPKELSFDDLWRNNWIINSSALVRRAVFLEMGGFNEDRGLISVEDYNLWLRIAAANKQIVTCPEVLTHYVRGIGLSSNIPLLARASLYNIDLIARELKLPPQKLKSKRLEIYDELGRAALFERNMALARNLAGKSLLVRPSLSRVALFLLASMPRVMLDGARYFRIRAVKPPPT